MAQTTKIKRLFDKIVDVRPGEIRALWLGFVFNFVVLGGYYVIRPIRDNIGAEGLENLSWMFTATLVTMLIANALFSAIVARMSRRKFIPIAYRFFITNLIIFFVLMRTLPPAQNIWVGRAFYVWVSVFNLFVVTVFWAFMTDLFNSDQGKRLFGFISVGGTLGGICGGFITASLVKTLGTFNLLLISALMLEIAAQCVRFFPANLQRQDGHQPAEERPIGGGILSGISHAFRSPYLLGICAFMLLHAITSTLVYFQQADITAHQFHDRAARTAFFAWVDLSVNALTIGIQIFLNLLVLPIQLPGQELPLPLQAGLFVVAQRALAIAQAIADILNLLVHGFELVLPRRKFRLQFGGSLLSFGRTDNGVANVDHADFRRRRRRGWGVCSLSACAQRGDDEKPGQHRPFEFRVIIHVIFLLNESNSKS